VSLVAPSDLGAPSHFRYCRLCGRRIVRSDECRPSMGCKRAGNYEDTLRMRIDAYVEPEPMSGCWLWTGTVNHKGYGLLGVHGRTTIAHRVVYRLFRGPIPTGLVLDHLCETHCCVNPAHLRPVTRWENTRRGISPPAARARQQRPSCGHGEFVFNGRQRLCAVCRRQTQARYYRRLKERQCSITC
jgi:hypothetical protein